VGWVRPYHRCPTQKNLFSHGCILENLSFHKGGGISCHSISLSAGIGLGKDLLLSTIVHASSSHWSLLVCSLFLLLPTQARKSLAICPIWHWSGNPTYNTPFLPAYPLLCIRGLSSVGRCSECPSFRLLPRDGLPSASRKREAALRSPSILESRHRTWVWFPQIYSSQTVIG
jgi:predicted outer membrane repeat protein